MQARQLQCLGPFTCCAAQMSMLSRHTSMFTNCWELCKAHDVQNFELSSMLVATLLIHRQRTRLCQA